MKISQKGINLIKNFEGCRLEAYKCPAGVWTIGYGHTRTARYGMKIDQATAEILLKQDLIIHENNVSRLVKVPLTQNQFDALVSFEYNVGYGNFSSSTLLRKLNARRFDEVPAEFKKWVYGGGKVLPGLVKRREAEKILFLS
ncbi:MAG: lysozyme [Candidatus Gastranaerophilaceae bacterium]